MKENNEKISPLQWLFLIAGFGNGSFVLLSQYDALMKQDTWIIILGGYIFSIPFVLSYFSLSKRFPQKKSDRDLRYRLRESSQGKSCPRAISSSSCCSYP